MKLAKYTTRNRLFLAILFSFLTVVGWESGAYGDLLNAPRSGNAVIGRMDDLNPSNLRPGERTLLGELSGDLGSTKANWQRNSSVLRNEMRKGLPIRDVSGHLPDSHVLPDGRTVRQTFLGMERNTLRNKGWTFDGEFWNPPTK